MKAPSPVRVIVASLCLVALGLGAAGCGGDSDSSTTSAGSSGLTKAAFLEQANAACVEERKDLEQEVSDFLSRQRGKKPQPELYADLAHLVILPVIEREMEAVRALGAFPGSEEEQQELRYVLYVEEAALNELALTNEVPSRKAIERRFNESGEVLSDYGLPGCANGLSAGQPAQADRGDRTAVGQWIQGIA